MKSIGVTANPLHSDEDQRAIKTFKESIKLDDYRYQVPWPWTNTKDNAATENTKMLEHIEKDTLSLKPTIASNDNMSSPTKRIALIELSSVYDPIGLFSPILFRVKMLLQRLWGKHLRWEYK